MDFLQKTPSPPQLSTDDMENYFENKNNISSHEDYYAPSTDDSSAITETTRGKRRRHEELGRPSKRHAKYDYKSNSLASYTAKSKSPRRQRKQKLKMSKEDTPVVYIGEVLAGQYEVLGKLGEGGFSLVVKCLDRKNGSLVAVKIQRSKYTTDAKYEIDTLQLIKKEQKKHPELQCYVIDLVDSFRYHESVCMVFPLCPKSLLDLLNERVETRKTLTLTEIKVYARQLLQTLAFIHRMDLAHGDIKPENILLSEDLKTVHLVDFGLAVFGDELHTPVVGTRQYSGPEIVLGLGWSNSLDIWSTGCVLAELYLGRPLFETHENMEHLALMEKILGPIPEHLIVNATPEALRYFDKDYNLSWPKRASSRSSEQFVLDASTLQDLIPDDGLRGLIMCMLRHDPSKRVSAAVALQHEFLKD